MAGQHNPKARLGLPTQAATRPAAGIAQAPPLPAIDFSKVGKSAPTPLNASPGRLPAASAVVITWADAEWAALEHVFCSSSEAMPYSARERSSWPGWQRLDGQRPASAPRDWSYWGEYRLVQVSGRAVLLFKSNTHLDWPGGAYLQELIRLLISQTRPGLVLSIGTAGGARPLDHLGTVRAVSAATLYQPGRPQTSWPEYRNAWHAADTTINHAGFAELLVPVPTRESDLQALCQQLNEQHGSAYTLPQLDPHGLNRAAALPQIDDQTGGTASLLTTSTFVVGTTSGNYASFACIEMDDALVGEACSSAGTAFGFVRNVSDPVQNAALPARVQGDWGSLVYDAYGLYTSVNGALTAWAMLA